MTNRSANVLFTSAGRRVELLRAFRRAFERLALDGRIVITDIDSLAPTASVADEVYLVPRLTDPAYVPTLLEICERERIDLVFPLIDPDIPLLAAHATEFAAVGTTCAVVSPEAAEIVSDKWLTSSFFRRIGAPTARSWLPSDLEGDVEFPLFIKPRRGSAGQHSYKVTNAEELAFFSRYVPDPIIQEFLPGPEITVDVTCDLNGEVLAIVCRKRIEIRSGEVSKGVTVYRSDIIEWSGRIARELKAIGPITVQCMLDGDSPRFTEVNPRFGGGVPLGIAAGVDAPSLLLSRYLGIPFEHPPLGVYRTEFYMTRFDDSFMLTEAERLALESRRFRSG